MTEVERLYAKMQATFGGNVPWRELEGMDQQNFVQAVNIIIQCCQYRKDTSK